MTLFRPISGWFDRGNEKALLPNPELSKAIGACGLMILAALLIGLSAAVSRIHVNHLPKPKVFLSQPGKSVQQVQILSTPSLSQLKVQRWTTRVMREVFSFNFFNYQTHMDAVSDDFTDLGWTAFQQGLIASKVEDRVTKDRLDVFLVPLSVARMIKIQRYSDVVVFHLQMPCLMVYRGATQTETKTLLADIIVRQIPTNENPDGVAISDLVLHVLH